MQEYVRILINSALLVKRRTSERKRERGGGVFKGHCYTNTVFSMLFFLHLFVILLPLLEYPQSLFPGGPGGGV